MIPSALRLVGLLAMPYYVVFEPLAPLIETIGYAVAVTSFALGLVDGSVVVLLFILSFSYGLVLSFGALIVEEHAFRRYRRWRDIGRLVARGDRRELRVPPDRQPRARVGPRHVLPPPF